MGLSSRINSRLEIRDSALHTELHTALHNSLHTALHNALHTVLHTELHNPLHIALHNTLHTEWYCTLAEQWMALHATVRPSIALYDDICYSIAVHCTKLQMMNYISPCQGVVALDRRLARHHIALCSSIIQYGCLIVQCIALHCTALSRSQSQSTALFCFLHWVSAIL